MRSRRHYKEYHHFSNWDCLEPNVFIDILGKRNDLDLEKFIAMHCITSNESSCYQKLNKAFHIKSLLQVAIVELIRFHTISLFNESMLD